MKGREVNGVIEDALPQGLYRVSTDDGQKVTVSIGGTTRQTTVRVIAGDRVTIEISPLDPGRGKIKKRLE